MIAVIEEDLKYTVMNLTLIRFMKNRSKPSPW